MLILNTIVLGFMLLYILVFSVINETPTQTIGIIFVSVVLVDVAVLLYKSGSSLNEFEKTFNGLGSGIVGCVLSALGLGMIQFVTLSQQNLYVYGGILGYCLPMGLVYIVLNEAYRRQ